MLVKAAFLGDYGSILDGGIVMAMMGTMMGDGGLW
jgi:hypothetical protein